MPVSNFDGNTFVAFIDICGFKEMVRQRERAWRALDRFYQLGYDVLRTHRQENDTLKVEGIFVSDCGILFVRGTGSDSDKLLSLLRKIKKINKGMLDEGFMLTTSIAYGPFKYQERIEFRGIEKNPIYGSAYLGAYLDSTNEKPLIQPGQCRIVIDNLPGDVITSLDGRQGELLSQIIKESIKHYYFYWNVENSQGVEAFKTRYRDAYNLKFAGMLKALKGEND